VRTTQQITIGLGRLIDFIIRDNLDRRFRVTPQGERWLAWKPDTRDLVVLRAGYGDCGVAKHSTIQQHSAFHGIMPKKMRLMVWPALGRSVHALGLIESLTYTAADIRSPSKGKHWWTHQFGDRGERGHGLFSHLDSRTFPVKFFPRLDFDSAGNMMIVRRPQNGYLVKDWIIG
jgi:hypothetical protein